jgi:uncharacterized protein (UPF0264 family)
MDLLQLWSNAANWQDIVDHLLLILGAICVAAVPSLFAARNHKGILEVKAQVKNAHSTNLRDDIDRAINAVENLGNDVRGIRSDLAAEEDRRREQIKELRDDVERRLSRG